LASSNAQTYTLLHTFGTNMMGVGPFSALVQGPDGSLYGTAASGGAANAGQVFKVNPDGSGYNVLKDFTGTDGSDPEAGLVLSGTTLYGTTVHGGTNGNGNVFKVNTDGTGFANLYSFTATDPNTGSNSDGSLPFASLVLSGTTLYGTTYNGGSFGNGTVFKVNTDGSGFAVLHSFSAFIDNSLTNVNGACPVAGLVVSGSRLYGTTMYGGGSGSGTVFAVNTDGSGFALLKEFTSDDGVSSNTSLVLSGSTLYGTTSSGGPNGDQDQGTVFALNTDGSGYIVLKDFDGGDDGGMPKGLVQSGVTLYGTTQQGGAFGSGTVFAVNTNGSGFAVLKAFANGDDGAHPSVGLVLSNTTLFGTTTMGGEYGFGTMFSVETDGSGYTELMSFAGGDGANPSGNLLLAGGTLFGTTAQGGKWAQGTVFKINIDGSGYTVLKDFKWSDGADPYGGTLVLSGATLYGTTFGGGNNCGTVFKVNTDGSGYSVLYVFSAMNGITGANADGAGPSGGLVLSGSTLYGTTSSGGTGGNGTVFAVNTDGSGFSVLHSFSEVGPIFWNQNTNADGAWPCGLVLSDQTLYGTAGGGGLNGDGTVFKVNTDGSGFSVLKHFSYSDGLTPRAGPVLCGTTLYGTTWSDNILGYGMVFSVNTDGSGFAVLKEFNGSDGSCPYAGVFQSGATLYGTTSGFYTAGAGTVFQVNTDGTCFVVLKNFNATWPFPEGNSPEGGVVLSGSALYGTANSGGSLGGGVLFGLSLLPGITTMPESSTQEAGAAVALAVTGAGAPPLGYQWFFDGTNALSGMTTDVLELADLKFDQSGAYTLVISNAFGAVTSAPVMLNVIPPTTRRPVPGVKLTGETGSLVNVDYADSLSPAPDWTTVGSVSLTSTSGYYFDLTLPLPPQRFFRAWQTGTPSVIPSLVMELVPAIRLTGTIGDSVRVDAINQFGPIDAWFTLDTVTLTNTSQLYFDTSAWGQPPRLYRLVLVP
jgi:uncharacterized repeat protein (TIGR03803 family)